MERICHITHQGTQVLLIDLSGIREVPEMERARAGGGRPSCDGAPGDPVGVALQRQPDPRVRHP
jgi:hypothetical protein